MADTSNLQQAAETLRDHFGMRLEAGKDEGRRLMADALEQRMNLSHHEATKLVESLEEARSIRWMEGRAARGESDDVPSPVVAGSMAQQADRVFGAVLNEGGYWQLGSASA